jgi:hypothetical protein
MGVPKKGRAQEQRAAVAGTKTAYLTSAMRFIRSANWAPYFARTGAVAS